MVQNFLKKIDELNQMMNEEIVNQTDKKKLKEKLCDDLEDYLIYSYLMGVDSANEDLKGNTKADSSKLEKSINRKTDGKTYKDRIAEKVDKSDFTKLKTLTETECTRVANEAIMDAGKALEAKYKTWSTMRDDKVRDTHEYLEGTTIPMGAEFYTFDGDHAMNPHGFEKPENNINCRCVLRLSK